MLLRKSPAGDISPFSWWLRAGFREQSVSSPTSSKILSYTMRLRLCKWLPGEIVNETSNATNQVIKK